MNALIVYGGWAGHEPQKVAAVLEKALKDNGFDVEMSETLESFADKDHLLSKDLIVPNWTMDTLSGEQQKGLCEAVQAGVGIAGTHGGMGDAFREATNYQFMVGGQFVAHPGGSHEYTVSICNQLDPIVAGMGHFKLTSEQYYMHVDPGITVLATCVFEANGVTVPVIWKKMFGKGRVFYTSLGHVAADFDVPEVLETTTRGMIWAAEGKAAAG